MNVIWRRKNVNFDNVEEMARDNQISVVMAKLLKYRGIETPEQINQFLRPNFKNLKEVLHNPNDMKDIKKAAERIIKAINSQEKILFLGDYDADGVTTTALFYLVMKEIGVNVDYDLPNRFRDGYGINIEKMPLIEKYDLVVTGDTGIREFEISKKIKEKQIDLIITDHHEPMIYEKEEKNLIPSEAVLIEKDNLVMGIPDAFAVVNPKRIDCSYPSKDLSGVAVIFKLLEVVLEKMNISKKILFEKLDIVSVGLIADLVPQFDVKNNTFEVRNLIKLGLMLMNQKPKDWTTAVKNLRLKNADEINSGHLAFVYGPLLNAPGRMEDPLPALEFLINENNSKTEVLMTQLNQINELRKKKSKEIAQEIEKIIENNKENYEYAIVVPYEKCHIGITGPIASEIIQKYFKPTIVLGPDTVDGEKVFKGSARSVVGVNILDVLINVEKDIGEYIYGGHEGAAGVTLKLNQVDDFIKSFNKHVKKLVDEAKLEGLDLLQPVIEYFDDIEIKDVTHQLLDELNLLEPFGFGNEKMLFKVTCFVKEFNPIMNGAGARFTFDDGGVKSIKGVTFKNGKVITEEFYNYLKQGNRVKCEFLGYPKYNTYKGTKNIQFEVEHIRFISAEKV